MLQKGPKPPVKTASIAERVREATEKLAFEQLTTPEASTEEVLVSLKLAAVEDPELLKIASDLADQHTPEGETRSLDEVLQTYEELGGTFKHAFGQQMFDAKQMAGSPAVSGGMASRAQTPTPQIQQSPVSVTTTTLGQNNGQQTGASQSAPSSQTSTPSAPTG